MRVVFDTNVFVSAALGSRMARRALVMAYRKRVTGVISYEALVELTTVLRGGIGWDDNLAYRWHQRISSRFHMIHPSVQVDVCRDPSDDKFLACALSGEADYIVSNDHDLLDLKEFASVKIITLIEFLRIVEKAP